MPSATKNDRLILIFRDSSDKNITFTFPYADTEVTTQHVKNLVASIINNTSIFDVTLVAAVSATLRVVSDIEVDLT